MADPDPLAMFRRWFDDAQAAHLHEPNAMIVATVSPDGQPAARTVLLKGLTGGADGGFAFYTNTASRKGDDLAHEPRCALLFPWHPLERQVRVEGVASRLTDAEVASYFAARPRGSQLGRARVSAVAGRRRSRGARRPLRRGGGAVRRRRGPGADGLGRLPGAARDVRVLAGPVRADARPAALPPYGVGLGDRAAGSLTGVTRRGTCRRPSGSSSGTGSGSAPTPASRPG